MLGACWAQITCWIAFVRLSASCFLLGVRSFACFRLVCLAGKETRPGWLTRGGRRHCTKNSMRGRARTQCCFSNIFLITGTFCWRSTIRPLQTMSLCAHTADTHGIRAYLHMWDKGTSAGVYLGRKYFPWMKQTWRTKNVDHERIFHYLKVDIYYIGGDLTSANVIT